MTKVSKIKVLCILPSINDSGGIEKMYFNIYKKFSDRISVDFITHECDSDNYRKIIKDKGNKLTVLPKMGLTNFNVIMKKIDKYFDENNYDIVHCHAMNYAYFYFKSAQKHNINVRLLHNHISKHADVLLNSIRNNILYMLSKRYITDRITCGKYAGSKMYKNEKYTVLYNSIDIKEFDYNPQMRKKIRNDYKISDNKIVLGSIGRMVPAKNQKFLLKIIKKLNDDYLLVFIGDGPMKDELKKIIDEEQIQNKVLFIESKSNIKDYYQMIDIIVMPSITEGLPMVAIEGQISGLKVLLSNQITDEVKLTENVTFIKNNNEEDWFNIIKKINVKERMSKLTKFKNSQFDSDKQAITMEKMYFDLSKKN